MKNTNSPQDLNTLFASHFRMLEPLGLRKDKFKATLYTDGYCGLMHSIADIVKTAMLALEGSEVFNSARISEPYVNISGVLALILDMLPYEEAELLDILYRQFLEQEKSEGHYSEEDLYSENLFSYSTSRVIG